MTAKDFRIWQASVGLNGRQVAEALGKSEDTVSRYRNGGVPAPEAAVVALAMSAIEAQLPPWRAPR